MGAEANVPDGDKGKCQRTIRWSTKIDYLARRLAAERDLEGGVSELLEALVLLEETEPRIRLAPPTSGYAKLFSQTNQQAREAAKLADELLKQARKKK